ncbi:MAG TPA: SDR family NAD(P)-dependent oxidoreductase [Steroidobacteraceae bacterium]|nr:SDR family NAD(P)-dependent oxidoreductase [Steroidobacteraceae bacterium]
MTRAQLWGLRRYAGQVALVTGGASGIGLAVVRRLREEGARVLSCDRPGQHAGGGGGDPLIEELEADVSDEAAVAGIMARADSEFGRLDVVVNCAGVVLEGSAQETALADWQRVLDVNLTGTFLICRYALPLMIRRRAGSIVNVASDAAIAGQTGQAAYCASKAGVAQFTRAAALDVAPHRVRVNCVCPCFVDTPLFRSWIDSSGDPARARAQAAALQPIGRIGKPEEVAAAIAFLASAEASFITGSVLPVDGGSTIP